MAGAADPRAAREIELANLAKAKANKKAAVLPQAAALLASILKAEADENHAALTGRARVNAVDRQAAQQRAEAEAAAQEGEGAEPVDVTQFFPPTVVGGAAPGGTGPPRSFMELAQQGGSANAIANRAVAPARQAAGTLPSAAPQQSGAGGGPPGMSIDVGGQTFSAPDTITTTRETTGPLQFGPGLFVPATTTEVTTQPNVLSAGDLLRAHQSQVQFEEEMRKAQANFEVQMALRSREAAVGMATDLTRATNAPPSVAFQAAGAYLAGQDDVAAKLLSPYGSIGAAQIEAERARARAWDSRARLAEQEARLQAGALYNPSVMLGFPPDPKPLTGSEVANIQASVQDDFAKVWSGESGLAGLAAGALGVSSAAERASRIENIGNRLSKVGQIMVFPRIEGGGWSSAKPAMTQLPATTVFGLLDVALDDNYPDTAKRDAARATAQALGLGTMVVQTDPRTRKPIGTSFTSKVDLPEHQPWVDRVHRGVRNHSPETMNGYVGKDGAFVPGIEQYAEDAVNQLIADTLSRQPKK